MCQTGTIGFSITILPLTFPPETGEIGRMTGFRPCATSANVLLKDFLLATIPRIFRQTSASDGFQGLKNREKRIRTAHGLIPTELNTRTVALGAPLHTIQLM